MAHWDTALGIRGLGEQKQGFKDRGRRQRAEAGSGSSDPGDKGSPEAEESVTLIVSEV